MDDEPTPLMILLTICVGALIRNAPARERTRILADIDREAGNPRVVPIHDGDHLRMSVALRELLERLSPSWM